MRKRRSLSPSPLLLIVAAALVNATPETARPASADPGLISISSREVRATVAPARGGELAGLEVKTASGWVQLLYRGNDYSPTADWTGHGPILWPATGRNFVAEPPGSTSIKPGWRVHDSFFPMPIHGFARDLAWTLVGRSRRAHHDQLVLRLDDNSTTRRGYPYGFRLTSTYDVSGRWLTIRQTVHADANNVGPMPFSIGNHVTFRLPLAPGGKADQVWFETPGRSRVATNSEGVPTGAISPADFRSSTPVANLPAREAVSLGSYPPTAWLRLVDPAGVEIRISHAETTRPPGTPVLFNLWGDVGGGFFSPEPWVGKQNSLATGDGAVILNPGKDFHWTISIEVKQRR